MERCGKRHAYANNTFPRGFNMLLSSPFYFSGFFFFFFFVILKRGEGALSALGVERAPLAVSGAVLFCELGFRMGGKRRKWVRA